MDPPPGAAASIHGPQNWPKLGPILGRVLDPVWTIPDGRFRTARGRPNRSKVPPVQPEKVPKFEVPEPSILDDPKEVALFSWPLFDHKTATFLVTFLDVKKRQNIPRETALARAVLIYILLIILSTFPTPWTVVSGSETSSLEFPGPRKLQFSRSREPPN